MEPPRLRLSSPGGTSGPGTARRRLYDPPTLAAAPLRCPRWGSYSRLGAARRRSCCFRLLAQLATQDFPDVRLRHLAAKLDLSRTLVAGKLRAAMRDQLLRLQLLVAAHDVKLHRLAGLAVGHADARAFADALVHHDDVFDLVRIHIESRHVDHVLLAVADPDVAVRVHRTDVAGLEIAVDGHRLRRFRRALPISRHDLGPPDADLARLVRRHVVPVVVA